MTEVVGCVVKAFGRAGAPGLPHPLAPSKQGLLIQYIWLTEFQRIVPHLLRHIRWTFGGFAVSLLSLLILRALRVDAWTAVARPALPAQQVIAPTPGAALGPLRPPGPAGLAGAQLHVDARAGAGLDLLRSVVQVPALQALDVPGQALPAPDPLARLCLVGGETGLAAIAPSPPLAPLGVADDGDIPPGGLPRLPVAEGPPAGQVVLDVRHRQGKMDVVLPVALRDIDQVPPALLVAPRLLA